jgi:hypothetical protein
MRLKMWIRNKFNSKEDSADNLDLENSDQTAILD